MRDFLKNPRTIFILLLSLLFVAASLTIAILGMNIYGTATSGSSHQELDKAGSYIADKVRRCEDKSLIRTASLEGSLPALVIESKDSDEDEITETWLFTADGYLKELRSKKGSEISSRSGDKIAPLKALDFQISNDNLLEINMSTDEGASSALNICLPELGGGANE